MADQHINVGRVKYIDYDKDVIEDFDNYAPFFHKRKSFEHEREVRAIFIYFAENEIPLDASNPLDARFHRPGHRVKVDVVRLIKHVFISPTSPQWYLKVVQDVCEKYGIDQSKVLQSDLITDPIW